MPKARQSHGNPGESLQGSVRRFLLPIQRGSRASSPSKMAPIKGPGKTTGRKDALSTPSQQHKRDDKLCPSSSPHDSSSLPAPCSPAGSENSDSCGLHSQVCDSGLRGLLSALPTKSDLQAWALDIKDTVHRELEVLKKQHTETTAKVTSLLQTSATQDSRLATLEASFAHCKSHLNALQLRVEDQENRNRRNNIKIRGIPETTLGPALHSTVTAILNKVMEKPLTEQVELDRVHRVPGPRDDTLNRPRDVLCRVHFFTVKEEIMRRAWRQGPVEFEGSSILLLPDLSRATLAMRRCLRPLLEVIRQSEATYKWGHPFHLITKKADGSFVLHSPDQLPALFEFLNAEPVDIPNWLDMTTGAATFSGSLKLPPRPQRSRSRRPKRADALPIPMQDDP